MNDVRVRLCSCSLWGLVVALAVAFAPVGRADVGGRKAEDSGGALIPEQWAYDVGRCELDLRVDPARKWIQGRAVIEARVLRPMSELVLDLDGRLGVTRVGLDVGREGWRLRMKGAGSKAKYRRDGARLWIELPGPAAPGRLVRAVIDYAGQPRQAGNPPWDGGFVWSKTRTGEPWIGTAVQVEGADLWWPCKDHPSDKVDGMTLRVRVPPGLEVAANGRLLQVVRRADQWRSYEWHTDHPINAYAVALAIAPFQVISTNYWSTGGQRVPVRFWVLPEHRAKAEAFLPEVLEHLNFYERRLGPYPWRGEKYGVVETPFEGMEHQTIIAYGSGFRGGASGFDWLHHHELGHEWFGNLVTAEDWKDFWVHEGFCTYMQALYAEERQGHAAYERMMREYRGNVTSAKVLVPDEARTINEMERTLANDVYYRGAWVLHTLRFLVGEERMFELLRRFVYPNPDLERRTDGSASRVVSSEDFVRVASTVCEQDLGWFFRVYLKGSGLPTLVREVRGTSLIVRWDVPGGGPFRMPVEVEVQGKIERIAMPEGRVELDASRYGDAKWDPRNWILKQ